ncbi:MAG: DUF2277 domain-containing protein [Chloroflexi bacterium]|nr:DUF2277 domain-containing protein [Chloroflexota bacterium]MCY4247847.1 DUF2277 domain-containing protein [Chloroflexota bacterium]
MCRNIRPLFNYEPASSRADMEAAALQYVRKVSGFRKPSTRNQLAFERAVREVAGATARLLESLETSAPPRSRAAEIAKARARNAARFPRA